MNKKGASLIWVAVVSMIVMIIVLVLTTTSLSFYRTAVDNIPKKQIYLTNRSTLQALSNEIISKSAIGNKIVNELNSSSDGTCIIDNFIYNEKIKNNFGNCVVTAKKLSEAEIKLSVVTKIAKLSDSLSITIVKKESDGVSSKSIFPTLLDEDGYNFIDWPEPTEKTRYKYKLKGNPHEIVTFGNGNDVDSYYFVDENSNFLKQGSINVSGSGNIYVFIRDNTFFKVDEISSTQITTSEGKIEVPVIYFIVGKNCKVILNEFGTGATKIYAYIYSPNVNSTVEIGKNKNSKTDFYGSIMVKGEFINNVGNNFLAKYVQPYKEPYISNFDDIIGNEKDPNELSKDVTWEISGITYEK